MRDQVRIRADRFAGVITPTTDSYSTSTSPCVKWWSERIRDDSYYDRLVTGVNRDTWKQIGEMFIIASQVLKED